MKIKKAVLFVFIIFFLTSCNMPKSKQNMKDEKISQSETLSKENVQDKLKRLVQEKTEQPVCAFYYINGSKEEDSYAFVFTGEVIEEKSYTNFQGSLWYADNQESILLMDKIDTVSFEPVIMEENNHLLLTVTSLLPGNSKSYIWAVNGHVPHLVMESFEYCFIDNGLLACVKTFISNSAGGRIWQRYYLYWDSAKQSYECYEAKEISEEEFLAYENAQAVRDEVAAAIKEYIYQSLDKKDWNDEGHFEYDYLKCDNGIIYINYVITIDSVTLYYYSILMEKNGVVALHYDLYQEGYMF